MTHAETTFPLYTHPRAAVRELETVPVQLLVEAGPHRGVSRALVARAARAMLRALEIPEAELSVMLTGDARIQELNRVYRHKDRPTDVLAFAQREGKLGERAGAVLGDVVISIPTARRQAEGASRPVVHEVLWLLAHGLLHLLGWDHDTPARDARMRRETARLYDAANPSVRARSARPRRARRLADSRR
jgi:probable rRNA maturation factor